MDDTDDVGYNPYRKKVVRKGDIALVVVGIAVALVAVAWAFLG